MSMKTSTGKSDPQGRSRDAMYTDAFIDHALTASITLPSWIVEPGRVKISTPVSVILLRARYQ